MFTYFQKYHICWAQKALFKLSLWHQHLLVSFSGKVEFPCLVLCSDNHMFLSHAAPTPYFTTCIHDESESERTRAGCLGFFRPVLPTANLVWCWLLEFAPVPKQTWTPTGFRRRAKATGTTSSLAAALLPFFFFSSFALPIQTPQC